MAQKDEGFILGHRKNSKSNVKKLTGKDAEIKTSLNKKVSKSAIARILGVHRITVTEFVKEQNIESSFNRFYFNHKSFYYICVSKIYIK